MNESSSENDCRAGRARDWRSRGWRRLRTLLLLALGSWLVTSALDYSARTAAQQARPAGWALGMLHGACMPATWPMLALGRDPVIYAVNNDGRPYKLGYTLGVNLCGALFFGLWFWRWQKWRQSRRHDSGQAAQTP